MRCMRWTLWGSRRTESTRGSEGIRAWSAAWRPSSRCSSAVSEPSPNALRAGRLASGCATIRTDGRHARHRLRRESREDFPPRRRMVRRRPDHSSRSDQEKLLMLNRRLLIALTAAAALSLAAIAAWAGPHLTIYSRDLGFVRETRDLEVSSSPDTVRLSDVSEQLDFSS